MHIIFQVKLGLSLSICITYVQTWEKLQRILREVNYLKNENLLGLFRHVVRPQPQTVCWKIL